MLISYMYDNYTKRIGQPILLLQNDVFYVNVSDVLYKAYT